MKSPICEICGKHAEVEPLGCAHYPAVVISTQKTMLDKIKSFLKGKG